MLAPGAGHSYAEIPAPSRKSQIGAVAAQQQKRLAPLPRIGNIPRATRLPQPQTPRAAENQIAAAFARILDRAGRRRAHLPTFLHADHLAPSRHSVAVAAD